VTPEQKQRARWDLLLLDIEARTIQVRQLKQYKPWKIVATVVTAAAAFIGLGFALAKLLT
jgi:hypothetical protein